MCKQSYKATKNNFLVHTAAVETFFCLKVQSAISYTAAKEM